MVAFISGYLGSRGALIARSSSGCEVRCWICTNRHSSSWEKACFLDSPRQGCGGSAQARKAACVSGRQLLLYSYCTNTILILYYTVTINSARHEGRGRSVKFSVPTAEMRSTIQR